MKTTYNGTYTQVDELESTEGFLILKQRLKDDVLKDSFVRANFLSGAHFLKTLKDSNLLTIDEVIESNDEVCVVCKNSGFQQLGVFLEDSSQLKDSYLVELISKMLNCLDSLHKNSIYHQGLNPNSFVVDPKGNVKLTLFGTLEHRLYHHLPAIGNENPSIQNAIRFYSPERIENYGVVNQSSEYYSFGLIIWYLLCVQRNLSSHKDLVLAFPDFSFTGSIWDKVLEACLNHDPKKRPKSSMELFSLLPIIENYKQKSKNTHSIIDESQQAQKIIQICLHNYSSFHHEIILDGKGLENFSNWVEDRKLTIQVNEAKDLEVFSKKNGSLVYSKKCINDDQIYLPESVELNKEEIVNSPITSQRKSKNLRNFIVFAVIFLFCIVFYQSANRTRYIDTHSGQIMNIPDGFIISDTLFTSVLTKEGYQLKSGERWRYNNGEWEKCELVKSKCEWENIQDESFKKYLDDFFFKKVNQNGYKFTNKEIEDFIRNYYTNVEDEQNLDKLNNYYEPQITRYYNVYNTNLQFVKTTMIQSFNSFKLTHDIDYKSIKFKFYPDSSEIVFNMVFKRINKFDGSLKNMDVTAHLTLSKNLKISSIY
jgi:serine/threonine protein kinase